MGNLVPLRTRTAALAAAFAPGVTAAGTASPAIARPAAVAAG
ncbi:hypothetical protein ACFXGI_00435 [Streptomyces sp. NPDC059355]